MSDTIAAIATPVGRGAVGIVKLSGPEAIAIAGHIFQPTSGPAGNWRLRHGHIVDPDTCGVIDEALLAIMRAPRSYTCEDVVEIQTHGGIGVIDTILRLVLRTGARLAEPGEFTRRAFLNGRIDLTQAEAVIDLINSQSRTEIRLAARNVTGHMRDRLTAVTDDLINLVAAFEAAIDFPDDVDEAPDGMRIQTDLNRRIRPVLKAAIENHQQYRRMARGIRIAIVGKPNVGKSSLMNQLVQKDKSIVTPHCGTTRDIVEDQIFIADVAFALADTAGIHHTEDEIEKIGIQRALKKMDACDAIVFVLDQSRPITEDDDWIYERIHNKTIVIAANKNDLRCDRFTLPDSWRGHPAISICARSGQHVDLLKQQLANLADADHLADLPDQLVPNVRQTQHLQQALAFVDQAALAIGDGLDDDCIVLDLKAAIVEINLILGIAAQPDYLDTIFNQFCIGK